MSKAATMLPYSLTIIAILAAWVAFPICRRRILSRVKRRESRGFEVMPSRKA